MNPSKDVKDKEERVTINVNRPAYDHGEFNEAYSYSPPEKLSALDAVKSNCKCSPGGFMNSVIQILPFIGWLREYKITNDLLPDFVAGCTVATMHTSQGMAYAMLANVPPIVGIYMAFFPVIAYSIFGTSRHVSIGTFAVVCIMTGTVVDKFSVPTNPLAALNGTVSVGPSATEVAAAVSLGCGIVQVIMYALRLGVVSVILSDLLISGLTTGAAVYVLTSQIRHLIGISVGKHNGPGGLFLQYLDIFSNLGKANIPTLVVTFVTMTILIVNEYLKPQVAKLCTKFPVPIELICLIAGSLSTMYGEFETKYKIKTVGDIPTGIPALVVPPIYLLKDMIIDIIMIGFVSYTITLSMAKIFIKRHRYKINANQEWLANGISNIVGSFASCAPVTASLSRSLVQERAGGKSQIAGLVSCSVLLVVLLYVGPFFETVPTSVLASIIAVALKGMFMQVRDLKKAWSRSYLDASLWLVPCIATLILDIGGGLIVSLVYSLVVLAIRSQQPYVCRLGKLEGTEIYKDVSLYKKAQDITGVKTVQFNGVMHYANIDDVKETIYSLVEMIPYEIADARKSQNLANNELVSSRDVLTNISTTPKISRKETYNVSLTSLSEVPVGVHYIILDLSNMGGIDSAGVDMLLDLIKEFESIDVVMYVVVPSGPADEMLSRCDFYKKLSPRQIYSTLNDAMHWASEKPSEKDVKPASAMSGIHRF